jgi:NAD(P)-dependent dehydrogenase (short-subunit alcohol dehydrogenase family)
LNPFSLEGKTALIVGASRGIGWAIAKYSAAAGARTILAARSVDRLEVNTADLKKLGYDARWILLDIADPESIRAAADQAGAVDILVNVAGTNIRKPFEEYTKEEYETLLQTNLHGIVEMTQRVGRRMIGRGKGGKIVMIGSLMSIRGLPYLSIYAISKGGLAQLTKVLAAEWGRYNIQVNCIAPGFIVTDLNRKMWQDPALQDWLKSAQANPRLGTPDDIAPVSVFLCSRAADYITGQIIAVDGGYSTTACWPFSPTGSGPLQLS